MGKTWEALGWWLARRDLPAFALPLTLFVPASEVSTKDPAAVISEALHKSTGVRNVEYWRRRLDTWMRATLPNHPRLLLVIDGLNQNPFFAAWGELLQRLFAPPFAGRVAVVVTDRPDDWKNRLSALATLTPSPYTVTVSPFGDEELDQLLAAHSLARHEFEAALLALLRIPRLCQLAIRLRRELQDSGDITRERLILEDWKDRMRRRGHDVRMNDAEFRDWVAEAGRRILHDLQAGTETPVSRAELVAQLGRDSGASDLELRTTISEIVDGRWLEPIGTHRFRVRMDLAPLALCLALLQHLRESPHMPPAAAVATFIDQLRGQDIVAAILRAATTAAFLECESTPAIRSALTTAWISTPNFHPHDFEALWRLTPLAPETVCDVAERFWSAAVGGHFRDEVLIKALANAYRWPAVATTLERRCTTWLGLYKSDPRANASATASTGSAERRQQTEERRRLWDSAAVFSPNSTPIDCRDDIETGWLAHRAIAVLSYLPRQPLARALRTWAVSRAVMGMGEEFDEAAWLLRWNPHDPIDAETAILRDCDTLLRADNPIATAAAGYLLKALATPRAVETAAAHKLLGRSPFSRPRSDRIAVTNGRIEWPREQDSTRQTTPPLRRAHDVREFAVDPALALSPGAAGLLRQDADATDVSTLWRTSGLTEEDHAVDVAAPVLARWAPTALADLLRRAYGQGSARPSDAVAGLAFALPRSLLVLQQEQVDAIAAVAARQDIDPSVRAALLTALLRDEPAWRQAELLLGAGRGIETNRVRRLFSPVQASDVPFLKNALDVARPPEDVIRILEFLLGAEEPVPEAYDLLSPLVNHADSRVRGLTLALIWQLNDPALVQTVRANWTTGPGMTLTERQHGSLILGRSATAVEAPTLMNRIDPQALGYLAVESGSKIVLEAFKDYLHKQVEDLVSGYGPSSFPAFWADELHATSTAISQIVQESADEVFSWLQPLMTDGAHLQAHEQFPFVSICRELLAHAPEKGVALWRKLHDLSHASSMRFQVEGFDALPFSAPDSPAVSDLRIQILGEAKNDRELASVVGAACEHKAHAWLVSHIEQALKQHAVGEVARAISIAGFLDKSPEADRLWAESLSVSPALGWVADVHAHARTEYQEYMHARHWFELFLSAGDLDKAHGAYVLFLACVDSRAAEWSRHIMGAQWDKVPGTHRAHHALCWPEVRKRAETRDRRRERTLFHTDIPSRLQAPWMH